MELEEAQEALELFITGLPVTQQQVADTQASIERKNKILALYKKEVDKIKSHIKEKYRELRQAGASATAQTAADSNGAAEADPRSKLITVLACNAWPLDSKLQKIRIRRWKCSLLWRTEKSAMTVVKRLLLIVKLPNLTYFCIYKLKTTF